jgi:hypothetical protein
VVFIDNNSGRDIAPGELELWLIEGGEEEFVSATSTERIGRDEYTWTYFRDPLLEGRLYRVIFRADCEKDTLEYIFRKSKRFAFRYRENWRSLEIDREDVKRRPSGNLIRPDLKSIPSTGKVSKADDNVHDDALAPGSQYPETHIIFAKPHDLIELDYYFEGAHRVVPHGGSHPNVVGVSPIGPRPIFKAVDKPVGEACYFEAKSPGDDWVSIEFDGHRRRYHIWVQQ